MVAMTLMLSLTYGQDVPPSANPAPAQTKTKVVYKEKSYYDFEDVLINGNVRAPDGSFIFRKSDSNFSSALKLKRSFIPELKESSTSAR
jgi:CRISPR/Cas system-associated protein Cas5 (RAMP superfamily)